MKIKKSKLVSNKQNEDKMVYKVSVIIPCHNSELTLKNCIESIINQSLGFENIELILYDNASTDSTRKIIQDYSKKFENIILYYSDINSGFPGTGRNKGLEVASSEYIMFMDSDDEYDLHMCETLYNVIINEKADVVCCEKTAIDEIGEMKTTTEHKSGLNKNNHIVITGDDIIKFQNISVWNKIFKKEIIYNNNLKFLENTYADDFAFSIDFFLKSKKLIYLKDYYGYKWNIHTDSISHNVKKKDITDLIIGYSYVCETLEKEKKEQFIDNVIKSHIKVLLIQCSFLNLDYTEFQEVLKEILIFEKKINFSAKLDGIDFNIINHLILNKKFKSAILCLRLINKLRNITTIRKIYRFYLTH